MFLLPEFGFMKCVVLHDFIMISVGYLTDAYRAVAIHTDYYTIVAKMGCIAVY